MNNTPKVSIQDDWNPYRQKVGDVILSSEELNNLKENVVMDFWIKVGTLDQVILARFSSFYLVAVRMPHLNNNYRVVIYL